MRDSWALCGLRDGITLVDWLDIHDRLWKLNRPWTQGLCDLYAAVQEELLTQWRALPADSSSLQCALENPGDFKSVVVLPEPKLPKSLDRGRECHELAEEIKTIHHKSVRSGLNLAEIKREYSSFKIWNRVYLLPNEYREAFLKPGMWEPGYVNLLLGKIFANGNRPIAPGTVNNWLKDYRAYFGFW